MTPFHAQADALETAILSAFTSDDIEAMDLRVGTVHAFQGNVHPDGPDAHIDRHVALQRAGWRIVDAYRSRWGQRPGELTVELVRVLTSDRPT